MSANQTTESHEGPAVAIIGSGPAGCYTAQFLRKEVPGVRIVVFEALPAPFGLVRYGVASDHQGAKAVIQQFERLFATGGVRFIGNVRVGIDIAFEQLAAAFDAVVLATGLPQDRRLGIAQDPDAAVFGAGHILRALNALPDEVSWSPHRLDAGLGDDIVVVGHGNVAMDLVRLLSKTNSHLVGSDIHDELLQVLRPSPPAAIHMLGRSSAAEAKFDLAMLREVCELDSVRIRAHGLDESCTSPVAAYLRGVVDRTDGADGIDARPATTLTLHFRAEPTRIRRVGDRTVVDCTDAAGADHSLPADAVVTAIGFEQTQDQRAAAPDPAWNGPHVYRVGWLADGACQNIAGNRKAAKAVAARVAGDLRSGPATASGRCEALLQQLPAHAVDWTGWKAIDEAERAAAGPDRCRRKIADLSALVAAASTRR